MRSRDDSSVDWLGREQHRHSLKRELQRLKRRARTRPIKLLVIAVLLTAATLYYKESREPPHKAFAVMRVTESDLMHDSDPLAGRDIEEYLRSVALSNQQLGEIIERHDLYSLHRARGEAFALSRLRQGMKISTVNNYFASYRGYSSGARSARITVRFAHKDPDVAFAVVRDLATTLIANEQRRRQVSASKIADIARQTYEHAERDALALRSELTRRRLAVEEARKRGADDEEMATLQVALSRTQTLTERAFAMLSKAEGQKRTVDLLLAADAAQLGLRFRIIDLRPPIFRPETSPLELAMWALALFVMLLPLCAIAIGAFDARLHDPEDLQRLGLPVVGHVPAFPGHDVGSLAARSRRTQSVP